MNIIITWPKTRPLESYVEECAKAHERGQQINFRIPNQPRVIVDLLGQRCYVVYDGFVRGWHHIVEIMWRGEGIVKDPVTGENWPEGWYVVRDPLYFPWLGSPVPMRGFQGIRYAREAPLA